MQHWHHIERHDACNVTFPNSHQRDIRGCTQSIQDFIWRAWKPELDKKLCHGRRIAGLCGANFFLRADFHEQWTFEPTGADGHYFE